MVSFHRVYRNRVLIASGLAALFLAGVLVVDKLTVAARATEQVSLTEGIPVNDHAVPLTLPLGSFARNTVSGGPGKDGIPAIDRPRFVSVKEADGFLDPGDIVFGVVLHNESPIILLVLGIQASASLIALFGWLVPIAIVLLIATLLINAKRTHIEYLQKRG